MKLTVVLVSASLLCAATSTSEAQSCADAEAIQRRSLIQMHRKRGFGDEQGLGPEVLDWNRIPQEIRAVGVSLFGTEANVLNVLQQSQVTTISYANVTMQVVMGKNDDAINRYGPGRENGFEYGLDDIIPGPNKTQIMDIRREQNHMINMIDVGGHLGLVSLAMYMKYPGLVRSLVVEPMPTSQFYLHLNLFLNGVPHLSTGHQGKPQPGIGAIQKAAAPMSNGKVDLCTMFHDQWSGAMNSFQIRPDKGCNCTKDICSTVSTISVDDIFGVFGNEEISLLKLDCEECEKDVLPVVAAKYSPRVKQLSGEMHMMPPQVVDLACRYNSGIYLNGMCQKSVEKNGTSHVFGKTFCDMCSSVGAGVTANISALPAVPATANTSALPAVPANISALPAVPANTSALPAVPANISALPAVPANTSALPAVPANVSALPAVPANISNISMR